ncbi:MAG TPA: class I SAM-dependent methyltransferase [Thermoguttaceae bacterium]|nr:class I SAM-dependent methyltransferase [Thermoguttaceae bacterium]
MQRREYPDYEAYLTHQRKKTSNPAVIEKLRARADERMRHFRGEFKVVTKHVPAGTRAICLGARLGEEVAVLRELGYDAIGIDLVPCPPLVEQGDFHHIPFVDGAFGLVYCNSVDHVFDLTQFAAEVRRVLEPGGWAYFVLRVNHWGSYESLKLEDPLTFVGMFDDFRTEYYFDNGLLDKARIATVLLRKVAE